MPNNLAPFHTEPGVQSVGLQSHGSVPSQTSSLITVTLTHVARVVAIFLAFGIISMVSDAELGRHTTGRQLQLPVIQFVCALLWISAILLLFIQKPWNGKRFSKRKLKKLFLASAAHAFSLFLWMFGLQHCGPMRAFLLDGAELPLLYVFATVTKRERPAIKKTRGVILIFVAYLLIMYDASGRPLPSTGNGFVFTTELYVVNKTRGSIGHIKDAIHDFAPRSQANPFRPGAPHLDEDVLVSRTMNKDLSSAKVEPDLAHDPVIGRNSRARSDSFLTAQREATRILTAGGSLDDERNPAGASGRKLLGAANGGSNDGLQDKITDSDVKSKEDSDDSESGGYADPQAKANDAWSPHSRTRDWAEELSYAGGESTVGIRGEMGIALILVSAIVTQAFREYNRSLATEIGGAKRYFSLMMTASAITMSPFAFISAFISGSMLAIVRSFQLSLWSLTVSFLYLVLPFYVRSMVSYSLSQRALLKLQAVVPFMVACLFTALYHGFSEGGLSVLLLFAFVLEVIGLILMTDNTGSKSKIQYELPVNDVQASSQ